MCICRRMTSRRFRAIRREASGLASCGSRPRPPDRRAVIESSLGSARDCDPDAFGLSLQHRPGLLWCARSPSHEGWAWDVESASVELEAPRASGRPLDALPFSQRPEAVGLTGAELPFSRTRTKPEQTGTFW